MSNINLTCNVCGREVRGYTWNNGMRFCAKCYQETFGNALTTQQLLDFIKNSGWNIGGLSNVVRLDKEAHNMELQQKVKVLEKALELACDCFYNNFGKALEPYCGVCSSAVAMKDYYLNQAKEMIKSDLE